MSKYGVDNFDIDIVEECNEYDLNDREKFWIAYYNSYGHSGYNQSEGGENIFHAYGSKNGNAKVNEEDVYFIRECYNNHVDKNSVYEKYYRQKIAIATFQNIWIGLTWRHIHSDVYTKENKEYHRHNTKQINTVIKLPLTEDDITEIKNMYMDKSKSLSDAYKKYEDRINYNTFKDLWYGKTYNKIFQTIHRDGYVK